LGVPADGQALLAVFGAVILAFVIRPLPMGPTVMLGLIVAAVTKALPIKSGLAGYGETVVWLVVGAFLIAAAVQATGLGRRIALTLVHKLGGSLLGLGYALCGAELVLGPVVPSNTARGGGILSPIVDSLARALGSKPGGPVDQPGGWLVLVAAHANLVTAAMFLTGMAANPLVAKAASDVLGVELSWGTWALGAVVPGLLSLAILPPLLLRLTRPSKADAGAARDLATAELESLGPWTHNEKVLGAVFVGLVVLWSSKPLHGMGTTLVAWIGVSALLLSKVRTWEDVVGDSRAWDTLVWLGGLLAMANGLKSTGVVGWLSGGAEAAAGGYGPFWTLFLLALAYFYSMYGFSMLTAHISAMVAAFLGAAAAGGAPPMIAAVMLAYFSNLCACLTNYSTGPTIIYFGLGYVPASRWFKVGFAVSLVHITVWGLGGQLWWRALGWG
jgi:DASS family divalent anion:Na+ symporter